MYRSTFLHEFSRILSRFFVYWIATGSGARFTQPHRQNCASQGGNLYQGAPRGQKWLQNGKNMKAAFLMKYQILVKITYLSGLYHFFCILAQPPAHSTNPALCVNEGRKAPILGSPLANQELLPFQQFIFRSLTASLTQFPIPSLSRGRPLTLKVSSFSFLSFPPSLCPPVYVCSNIGPGGRPIKL